MSVCTLRENTLYLKPFRHHAQGETSYCHRQFMFEKSQLKRSPGSTTDIQHHTLTTDHAQPHGIFICLSLFHYIIPSFCCLYSQWLTEVLLQGPACFHKLRNSSEATAVYGRPKQTLDLETQWKPNIRDMTFINKLQHLKRRKWCVTQGNSLNYSSFVPWTLCGPLAESLCLRRIQFSRSTSVHSGQPHF